MVRWLRNLERGSRVTAEVSIRRLGKACNLLGLSPERIVAEANDNPKQFQDSLEDIVSKLEDESKAPGYVATIVKVIRSWLKYNNVVLTRHIKIKNSSATPTRVMPQPGSVLGQFSFLIPVRIGESSNTNSQIASQVHRGTILIGNIRRNPLKALG